MSDFKIKMHQIRFRLGFHPRSRWGAYSAPPDPLAGFGGRTSKGRRGGREGKGREGKRGGKKGKEREGKGLKPRQSKFSGYVAAEQCSLTTSVQY